LSTGPAWGTPPWDAGPPLPAVTLPRSCDVVIVGAGLTGLSAAYHLARRGADVVVLEAQRVGAGASGRTGAIALEGPAAGVLEGADDCLGALGRLAREAEIACDLELGGCWELEHLPAAGAGSPLWQDGDGVLCVARTEPGGTVDAGALLRGLAAAARELGVPIAEGAPVAPLGVDRHVVLADGGQAIVARHVVVATEALTGLLVPLPASVSAALTLALATDPLDDATLVSIGLGERRPFYTADLPYLWGRPLPDGRLVVGSGLVFPDDGDPRSVSIAHPEAEAALTRLETRLRGFHPALAACGVSARWGGPVGFRSARTPICAWHRDLPGVLVTGAYAGHGVALSVRLGESAADAILDGRPLPAWGRIDQPLPEGAPRSPG
jgi:gamma-glutamylputrescine oxidase